MSRAAQDVAEIQVGVGVYGPLDTREDQLVERLLTWLRSIFVAAPARLNDLDRWEKAWRSADRNADRSVLELGELASEAADLLASASA